MEPEKEFELTIPMIYEADVHPNGDGITNEFRAKNTPGGENARGRVTSKSVDGFNFTVHIAEIWHGTTDIDDPQGDEEIPKGATFIRFIFRFSKEGPGPSRKFRRATVAFIFEDQLQRAGMEPHILQVAPDKAVISEVTSAEKVARRGFNVGLHGSSFTDHNVTKFESNVHASIMGTTTWSDNRSWGNLNVVKWMIEENPATMNGISDYYETGLLLSRELDDSIFQMKCKVSLIVDARHQILSSLQRWGGMSEADDPVEFYPSKQKLATEEEKHICCSLQQHMARFTQKLKESSLANWTGNTAKTK